jgi:hypothetical protein
MLLIETVEPCGECAGTDRACPICLGTGVMDSVDELDTDDISETA